MNSSARLWGGVAALLLVSVSLKVATGAPSVTPAQSALRLEALHRFLVTTPAEQLEGVASGAPGSPLAGWRFRVGGCQAAAFPSEKRGTMDSFARSHGRASDRVAYVYRGKITSPRPTWALARDVIVHHATGAFRSAGEPGYVVVIYSKACAGPPDLPWGRMPAI